MFNVFRLQLDQYKNGYKQLKFVHQENLKNIKTTNKSNRKQFDAVNLCANSDKLSEELSKMSKAEIIEYFKRRKTETSIKPCA